MNIPIFRYLIAVFILLVLLMRIIKFSRRETSQTAFKLLTTIFIWGSIFAILINPSIAYFISRILGIGENLNTLIFIAFIFVFLLIFKILGIIEKIEKNITEIIRKEALKNIKS